MSRKRRKKRKLAKPRELATLMMIIHCKGGFMKDRRKKRNKRLQREIMEGMTE